MKKLTFTQLLIIICLMFAGIGAVFAADSWGWFLVVAVIVFIERDVG